KEPTMNQEEQGKKMSQLIAKCWADKAFKQKVLADPAATLRAEGLELPGGVSYVAHENTDKVVHLIIPAKPTELADDVGDGTAASSGHRSTCSRVRHRSDGTGISSSPPMRTPRCDSLLGCRPGGKPAAQLRPCRARSGRGHRACEARRASAGIADCRTGASMCKSRSICRSPRFCRRRLPGIPGASAVRCRLLAGAHQGRDRSTLGCFP